MLANKAQHWLVAMMLLAVVLTLTIGSVQYLMHLAVLR
jgi:hypothetical protein